MGILPDLIHWSPFNEVFGFLRKACWCDDGGGRLWNLVDAQTCSFFTLDACTSREKRGFIQWIFQIGVRPAIYIVRLARCWNQTDVVAGNRGMSHRVDMSARVPLF